MADAGIVKSFPNTVACDNQQVNIEITLIADTGLIACWFKIFV